MKQLAVTITRQHGLSTVTLDGELDASNAAVAAEAIHAAIRLAAHTVVVDALGITFIDAAGRRALDCLAAATAVGKHPLLLTSTAIQRFDRRLVASRASRSAGVTGARKPGRSSSVVRGSGGVPRDVVRSVA